MLIHTVYAYYSLCIVSCSLQSTILFWVYRMSFLLSQCVFMCTPDVIFNLSNVMRKVRGVRRWWGNGSLTYYLCIPKSKQEEIRQNFPDEMEQKRESISYLINTDPLAGWRRLISALDRMRKSHLADQIRPNAEPLTGVLINSTLLYSLEII